ncbi:hypothetical protein GCM10025868_27890 [Angustibacter aerolatus]|uniref:JmjC domain-containing protein n=1 Tax=Angustibacter aerolatus TaxID=1162965 RepID=A0ABQ6JI79_9ACTN|nr:hypothetical protein GCM10025868_27890 [Angustibacter aerolatus]
MPASATSLSDDKVLQQAASGSTLVLQALHRTWPPIVRFAQRLAADLGHPVQANAYVTPPQNRGFDDHYDVHDVFVLQVEGEKRWRIHAPVLDAPCATSRGPTGARPWRPLPPRSRCSTSCCGPATACTCPAAPCTRRPRWVA